MASIDATGSDQVTIKLKQPDNWLLGELSQMPGIVLEKAYVESEGKAFGTPSGGTMCTGPFKLKSWRPGRDLTAVRNDAYWDTSLQADGRVDGLQGLPRRIEPHFGPLDERDHRLLSAAADHAGADSNPARP